jgi:hypothetical protein
MTITSVAAAQGEGGLYSLSSLLLRHWLFGFGISFFEPTYRQLHGCIPFLEFGSSIRFLDLYTSCFHHGILPIVLWFRVDIIIIVMIIIVGMVIVILSSKKSTTSNGMGTSTPFIGSDHGIDDSIVIQFFGDAIGW